MLGGRDGAALDGGGQDPPYEALRKVLPVLFRWTGHSVLRGGMSMRGSCMPEAAAALRFSSWMAS